MNITTLAVILPEKGCRAVCNALLLFHCFCNEWAAALYSKSPMNIQFYSEANIYCRQSWSRFRLSTTSASTCGILRPNHEQHISGQFIQYQAYQVRHFTKMSTFWWHERKHQWLISGFVGWVLYTQPLRWMRYPCGICFLLRCTRTSLIPPRDEDCWSCGFPKSFPFKSNMLSLVVYIFIHFL